jgi:hypothetical protein
VACMQQTVPPAKQPELFGLMDTSATVLFAPASSNTDLRLR